MNKRLFLWVIFLMSLFMLWTNWQTSQGKASFLAPAQTSQTAKTEASSAATSTASSSNTGNVPSATQAAPVASEIITITTDLYKAEIDTLGGELRHLELLNQKDGADTSFGSGWKNLVMGKKTTTQDHNIVLFDKSDKRTYLAQSGLLGNYPNHKSLFVAKAGARTLDASGQVQLVLEAEQNGVKLVKTYTFKKGAYSIGLSHKIENQTSAAISPNLYLQLVRDGGKLEGESRFYSTFTGPAVYTEEGKFQKLDFEKIAKGSESHVNKADNGWFAMIQHYFVSGIIPQDKTPREIFTKKGDGNLYAVGNVLTLPSVAAGAEETFNAQIYSGPLVTSTLTQVAPNFDLTKDYGWTAIVAKPVFWLMDEIHNLLGNWGWTIIVLTLVIKLAFFPLSAASFRSMGKMKLLTPKMTEIRERFKNDPQKMNQAVMELYKNEKVNPLGGCLPILIQMPVFMALYSVVLASVELRNATWLGWIVDLSTPDPYLVLPILMAVTMFIQTKLNPAPADPMQAKMMLFMPLVFSVMFFFFPSGLVLYWVVNNVLTIAQQWVITKKIMAGQ